MEILLNGCRVDSLDANCSPAMRPLPRRKMDYTVRSYREWKDKWLPTFSHARLLHRTGEFSLNPEYVMDYTGLGPIRTRRTSAARRVTEIDKTSTFASPLLSAQAGGKRQADDRLDSR
jgi:hypothetical protein